MHRPQWLNNDIAKDFWKAHAPQLMQAGTLTDVNKESFAILCQVYAHLRCAPDLRERKIMLDFYLKFAKPFGLLPDKRSKQPEGADELSTLLG